MTEAHRSNDAFWLMPFTTLPFTTHRIGLLDGSFVYDATLRTYACQYCGTAQHHTPREGAALKCVSCGAPLEKESR